jgi:fructose-specific phosphotransferase system component IIB
VKILCVTSCFSGIVSTYLAEEALQLAGEQLGHEILIETQGPAGSVPFAESDFEQVDGVIFAVDIPVVDRERFAGMPYLEGEIAPAIQSPRELINRLVTQINDGTANLVASEPASASESPVTATPPAAVDSSSERGFVAKLFGRGRRK